jgi:hypothetical protein
MIEPLIAILVSYSVLSCECINVFPQVLADPPALISPVCLIVPRFSFILSLDDPQLSLPCLRYSFPIQQGYMMHRCVC